MKIALLTEKYTPDFGGLAISSTRLANLLASAGHDVYVLAWTSGLPASEERILHSGRLSVTRFGAHKRSDDTLVECFERVVREHKHAPFDVLHAYFLPHAGFVAAYAGEYLGVPSIVSIRGNDVERAAFDAGKFSHIMYALQHASALTTNANELAAKARAFHERDICVIPNGIDTAHFTALPRNADLAGALDLSNDECVIGFVGELRAKKGLRTLLRAYAQVIESVRSTLLIVGEVRRGEDAAMFEEFKDSHPNARILVTGPVAHEDLPAYYSLIDVFVHPSLRDGMPNAVLEAMACERPVIASAVGGIIDVVRSGHDGLLIPANDAGALEENILRLLKDVALRASLGAAARRSVTQRLSLAKELEGNLQVYHKLGLKA